MKELFLFGLIILVAVILLGIYTGEKIQAKNVLRQLPSYGNKDTIENFGPSVANLGDISSGSSTLYNWSKSGNLTTAMRAPETCEEATPEPAAEETCVEPAPVPNSCEEENNCVEPVDTSNYKMCRTCDITVNKDIDKYVLKSSVPPCPNMKNFATKNMISPNINMDDYILKSKIPSCPKVDMSQYILKKNIPPCPDCPKCPKCPVCPVQEECKKLYEYNITEHPEFNKFVSNSESSVAMETALTGEENKSTTSSTSSSTGSTNTGTGSSLFSESDLSGETPIMETIPNDGGYATFVTCSPFNGS